MTFFAPSGTSTDRSDWQRLEDHLLGVEILARTRAQPLGRAEAAGLAGRFHDLGQYDRECDRIQRGAKIRPDPSTAGGSALIALAPEPKVLAKRLQRANLRHGGVTKVAARIPALGAQAQGFVIVNGRKHALALDLAGCAAGPEGMVHLPTRQTPFRQRQIIADSRCRLARGLHSRLVATRRIKAGATCPFRPAGRPQPGWTASFSRQAG